MRPWVLFVVLLSSACTESVEDPTGVPTFDAGAAARDGSSDGARPTDAVPPAEGARPVLNELRSGSKAVPEYVELYNPTSKSIELSGWGVGGQKSDGSDDTPFAFPAGTTIASGGYVVLTTNMKDDSACKTLGVSPCFFTAGGISGSRGETMRLLDASGVVVETASIPAIGAETGPTLAEAQSWGRLPNGTGEFVANRPTPGATNQGP